MPLPITNRRRKVFKQPRLIQAHQALRGRTINVQWVGNGTLFAVVAVPGISNLRVVNTLNSSTPVASQNISFIINCLRKTF
jgi:hypothetical protein